MSGPDSKALDDAVTGQVEIFLPSLKALRSVKVTLPDGEEVVVDLSTAYEVALDFATGVLRVLVQRSLDRSDYPNIGSMASTLIEAMLQDVIGQMNLDAGHPKKATKPLEFDYFA